MTDKPTPLPVKKPISDKDRAKRNYDDLVKRKKDWYRNPT